jgi:hypothetical protein
MAKGYPTPREREVDPLVGYTLSTGACMICKKRPAEKGGVCASCDAVLSTDR